jgi:hypothetical protein
VALVATKLLQLEGGGSQGILARSFAHFRLAMWREASDSRSTVTKD